MIINTDLIYPIGSIYLSMKSTNPSTYFGGTWKQISKGRCLVGVDTSQTEFNAVNKTGGSKYLQQHKHTLTFTKTSADLSGGGATHYHNFGEGLAFGISADKKYTRDDMMANSGTGNAGNLQPYLTCYIWQRTA